MKPYGRSTKIYMLGRIIMKHELIKTELNVINNKIGIMRVGNIDYISITDLARYKDKNRTDYII